MATTTASRGWSPPRRVRRPRRPPARGSPRRAPSRSAAGCGRADRSGVGAHRVSSARTAAVSLSARSVRSSTEFAAAQQLGPGRGVRDPREVDLDVDPGGRRGRAGGLGGRGHVADHVGVADRAAVPRPGQRIRHTSRTRAAGGRAAPSVAAAMAADRCAACAVVALRQPVRLGHRCERGASSSASVSASSRSRSAVLTDLVHQLGVLGVPGSVAVARDHGHECGGLGGVQRRRRAAPRVRGPWRRATAGSSRWCRCAWRRPLGLVLGRPRARRTDRTDPDQHGQRRIRVISGSTSGSAATVAGMRRPKYSISTAVPGTALAGSHA